MTILGISLGTRISGVCVLKDGELLERQVHKNTRQWSDTKQHIIVNWYKQYLQKHTVHAIMVKIPPLNSHSKAMTATRKHIERLAKQHHCDFDLITRNELLDRLHLDSTKELVQYTMMLFPQLQSLYQKGLHNDHSYYKPLYEAILSAYTLQERQKRQTEQLAHSN